MDEQIETRGGEGHEGNDTNTHRDHAGDRRHEIVGHHGAVGERTTIRYRVARAGP